jgi:hypothetical protein
MASVAVKNLENMLQARKLGSTLGRLRETSRVMSTGLPGLDQLLGGGWRVGAVSELIGRRSSGRATLIVRTLAEATRQGRVAALIDALDRFDPRSAEALGVDLASLLWVRGAPISVEMARPPVIDQAIRHAVRAVDLVMRAGGFGTVVLDLADVPPRRLQALPAITWLRLAHTTEGRDTVCLLVGDAPMGRSAWGVSVEVTARPQWTGHSPQSRRFAGFMQAFTVRAAHERPEPAVHEWARAVGAER